MMGSLGKAVCNMLGMLHRMAVRTEHFKIREFVVMTIAILVVHAKDRLVSIEPATFASAEHSSPVHRFAHGRECRLPGLLCRLVYASAAAIDTVLGGRSPKTLLAMPAFGLNGALQVHRLVVARWRAILRSVGAARNVLEHLAALGTCSSSAHPGCEGHARARAIERSVSAIEGHRESHFAVATYLLKPHAGAFHAT